MEQLDERMCNRRLVFARIKLVRKRIEGEGIISEVGDIKDGFGKWKIQPGQVGIKPCVWRSKVRYARGRTNTCASLCWPSAVRS
jgi:hypothetical protein